MVKVVVGGGDADPRSANSTPKLWIYWPGRDEWCGGASASSWSAPPWRSSSGFHRPAGSCPLFWWPPEQREKDNGVGVSTRYLLNHFKRTKTIWAKWFINEWPYSTQQQEVKVRALIRDKVAPFSLFTPLILFRAQRTLVKGSALSW